MVNYEALLIETNNELARDRVKNSCILSIPWTGWSWRIVPWALWIMGRGLEEEFSGPAGISAFF
jgi:hypothetical protein